MNTMKPLDEWITPLAYTALFKEEEYELAGATLYIKLRGVFDAGFILRAANLDFERNFDTKVGVWKVYVRWLPVTGELKHENSLPFGIL